MQKKEERTGNREYRRGKAEERREKLTAHCLLLTAYCSLLLVPGCYSFSGAALPAHIRTVAVPIFGDESRSGVSQLRERLTQRLADRIQTQSPLIIEQSRTEANAILEGVVTAFTEQPSVIGGATERATQNRVSITVGATYRDLVKKKTLFKENFNAFKDYPIGNDIARLQAIDEALTLVSENMLNKILSGW
jgi:hypothetical protein